MSPPVRLSLTPLRGASTTRTAPATPSPAGGASTPTTVVLLQPLLLADSAELAQRALNGAPDVGDSLLPLLRHERENPVEFDQRTVK